MILSAIRRLGAGLFLYLQKIYYYDKLNYLFQPFLLMRKHCHHLPVSPQIYIMKKTIILSVIAASTLWFGCKSKDKEQGSTDSSLR
jgi:hypothetical protein